MKKRSTVEKNEWSFKREEWYKSESLKMAFNMGFELTERDQKVYRVHENNEELFCVPDKSKSLWFETWKQLKKV